MGAFTRIIHLSDLHFPSRDKGVAEILAAELVQKNPDVLVVTGDMVNHASWWVSRGWKQARQWLTEIRDKIEKANNKIISVLVLPGNHDVLFSGLVGWCWPGTRAFARAFRGWYEPGLFPLPGARLTFLTLDSNPRMEISSAKGKAIPGRLKKLKAAMDEQKQKVQQSTKILLMHHHPLPVPFEGSDWLLETRRVDLLLRFVAENDIDLILHGHKHHATWSLLRIGGTSEAQFFVEVLGAGSAMKKTDNDPRGHHFNVIDIARNGTRRIRQFFKAKGAEIFSESPQAGAEETVSRLVLSRFRQPYRIAKLKWRATVDGEGDADNVLIYTGIVFNREREDRILLPVDVVEIGRSTPYRLADAKPVTAGARLENGKVEERERTFLTFAVPPREEPGATATAGNFVLDSYFMNRQWAAARDVKEDRDELEYDLVDIVEELCLELEFPDEFQFKNVRLEVREAVGDEGTVHQRWTNHFKNARLVDAAKPNVIQVVLLNPPPNLCYRLSWELPEGPVPVNGAAQARRHQFERFYLSMAFDNGMEPHHREAGKNAILHLIEILWTALDQEFGDLNSARFGPKDFGKIDVSFMVCERNENKTPQLRMVSWSGEPGNQVFFRNFQLKIGEGNAGRAYRAGAFRCFDYERAQNDPKANTYCDTAGTPRHRWLLSIPIWDPVSHVPIAVFNIGTVSPDHAPTFRALGTENLQKLVEAVHQESCLTKLLAAASI